MVTQVEAARFIGWPAAAVEVVERAVERHGGWRAWEGFRGLRGEVGSFGGKVGEIKGVGKTFTLPAAFEVHPKEQRTVFPDFPRAGHSVIYRGGDVTVLRDGPAPKIVEEHRAYRRTFSGLAKLRKWSDLDVAYFVGYSLANYHGYPFMLPALAFVRARSYRSDGGDWARITLEYPEGADCHGRRQTFHFDPTGLLRRADYRAEVVGPGPSAAHFYEGYREVAGLLFPGRRRVLARLLGWVTQMNLLTVDFRLTALTPEDPRS